VVEGRRVGLDGIGPERAAEFAAGELGQDRFVPLLMPSTSARARAVICCACSGVAGTSPASGAGPLLVGGRLTEDRAVGRLAVGRVVVADGLGFMVDVALADVALVVVLGATELVVGAGPAVSSSG